MRIIFLYALLSVFSFISCSKKTKQEASVYPVAAYIGNSPWNTNSVTASLIIDTTHGDRIVTITASGDSKTITMEFFDSATGNSVNTASHSFPDAYFGYAASAGSNYAATYGVITITGNTASSKTLSADFDFIVKDNNGGSSVHISNGHLVNVAYNVTYK